MKTIRFAHKYILENIISMAYEIERLYHRVGDIHEKYDGQRQGGISTPSKGPYIFLFTGKAGEQHGYKDGFEENGVFIYTGEGQEGDMEFVRGNKAIRDHSENGKELLLFEASSRKGFYRYKGKFTCAGYDDTQYGPDTNGRNRKLIRFQLVPLGTTSDLLSESEEDAISQANDVLPLENLRQKAYEASKSASGSKDVATAKRSLYIRSKAVKKYVLNRANGICESCKKPAPFKKRNGQPYLEPHHIRQLSDDGLDSPLWVGAICPSCHREVHHGRNGTLKNEELCAYVRTIETNYDLTGLI